MTNVISRPSNVLKIPATDLGPLRGLQMQDFSQFLCKYCQIILGKVTKFLLTRLANF